MPNNLRERFLEHWKINNYFTFKTSGSTGKPKNIELSKNQLIASAKLTIDLLNIKPEDTIYCCLPMDKISGFMQMARAHVANCNIQIVIPNSNPISELKITHHYSFISLTPQMLFNALELTNGIEILNKFKGILIGGGEMSKLLVEKVSQIKTPLYHTYGMTETCSHIAIKRLNGNNPDPFLKPLSGIIISTNKDNCLIINGLVTDNNDIITNDIAKIYANNSFEILGRKDFIINTGGVKYCAEEIEKYLSQFTKTIGNYIIYPQKHPSLGEQVYLLAEPNVFNHTEILGLEMPENLKYAKIKKIMEGEILLTSNGKIDRINSIKKAHPAKI